MRGIRRRRRLSRISPRTLNSQRTPGAFGAHPFRIIASVGPPLQSPDTCKSISAILASRWVEGTLAPPNTKCPILLDWRLNDLGIPTPYTRRMMPPRNVPKLGARRPNAIHIGTYSRAAHPPPPHAVPIYEDSVYFTRPVGWCMLHPKIVEEPASD